MNKQREAVYGLRRQLLEGSDQKELIVEDYVADILSDMLDEFAGERVHPDQWDIKGLKRKAHRPFRLRPRRPRASTPRNSPATSSAKPSSSASTRSTSAKNSSSAQQAMRYHERMIMLSVIDGLWKDHLLQMDHLKEGIGLRGYGQQDPLVAYKKESFEMFEGMMTRFQEDTVRFLFLMRIVGPDGQPVEIAARPRPAIPAAPPVPSADGPVINGPAGNGHRLLSSAPPPIIPTRAPSTTIDELEREFERKKKRELEHARMAGSGDAQPAQRRTGDKVGRNDPCPCGSGKKYKKCHGATEA